MKYAMKALLVLTGIIVASMFYLFYSIHSSYYQGVRSIESYKYTKNVTTSLSKYYSIHSKYPSNMGELNLEESEQHYIGKIIFDNQTGVIKIQIAGESLNEGTLIFFPQIKHSNELSYICHPLNVPAEYIPKECAAKEIDSNSSPQSTIYEVK